jgi:hypothetical protein
MHHRVNFVLRENIFNLRTDANVSVAESGFVRNRSAMPS